MQNTRMDGMGIVITGANSLETVQQIEVLNDDIVRLERNFKDAYNQYQGGLVDKTDYKRATITLNNSKAEKKSNEEALKAKYLDG